MPKIEGCSCQFTACAGPPGHHAARRPSVRAMPRSGQKLLFARWPLGSQCLWEECLSSTRRCVAVHGCNFHHDHASSHIIPIWSVLSLGAGFRVALRGALRYFLSFCQVASTWLDHRTVLSAKDGSLVPSSSASSSTKIILRRPLSGVSRTAEGLAWRTQNLFWAVNQLSFRSKRGSTKVDKHGLSRPLFVVRCLLMEE